MIEQIHKISTADTRAVEKVIQDENIHYIHMVFPQDQGMPEHFSNSTVYMTVLRGTLSNTRMNVRNLHPEILELIVVKAPAPRAS